MKCNYEFDVKSSVQMDQTLIFTAGGLKFELCSSEKRFSKIKIEIGGVKFSEYPRIENDETDGIPRVTIPIDPALASLEPELRAVRGALSIWGINDINTATPKCTWIPETEIEKSSTDVLGASISKKERPPTAGPLDIIVRTILSRKRFIEYEVPLEFFRRGSEDVYYDRFIEAIYDFYFVFEYLWGNGKFRKKDIVSQFNSSSTAVACVNYAKANPPPIIISNRPDINLYRDNYYKKSAEEIFTKIVDLRGFLHHQSAKRHDNWNPSSDRNYKVDAHFLHIATHKAISDILIGILFEESEVDLFKATSVITNNGAKINWTPMVDSNPAT